MLDLNYLGHTILSQKVWMRAEQKGEQGLVFALQETQISLINDEIKGFIITWWNKRIALTNRRGGRSNSDGKDVKMEQFQVGRTLAGGVGWGAGLHWRGGLCWAGKLGREGAGRQARPRAEAHSPPGDRQGGAHKGQGQAEESPECQLELTLH